MFALLATVTAALAAVTLLPLWRHEAWWVRGWDFPRLQLTALAAALLAAGGLLLDPSRPRSWILFAVLAACVAYQAWWILPYTRLHRNEVRSASEGGPEEDRLRILSVNVLTPNRDAEALLGTIRNRKPDVVIAVETDEWWQSRLDRLEGEYPHSLKCPLDNLYGMHLYSRLPLEDARIQFLVEDDVPSMHAAVVLRSGRRVRLHCLHPKPPSPTENPESSERDAELLIVGRSAAEAQLPVVVAGDLNDVAWSETTRLFRKVSGLLDPRVGRGMFNTFHAKIPLLRWPLDHLFHSRHFRLVSIERLGAVGSDHFPILVELRLMEEGTGNGSDLRADAEDREIAGEKSRGEGVDEDDVHSPGE